MNQVAPTEFENELEKFTSNDVKYWKRKAQSYYNKYVKEDESTDNDFIAAAPVDQVSNGAVNTTSETSTETTTDIPW